MIRIPLLLVTVSLVAMGCDPGTGPDLGDLPDREAPVLHARVHIAGPECIDAPGLYTWRANSDTPQAFANYAWSRRIGSEVRDVSRGPAVALKVVDGSYSLAIILTATTVDDRVITATRQVQVYDAESPKVAGQVDCSITP